MSLIYIYLILTRNTHIEAVFDSLDKAENYIIEGKKQGIFKPDDKPQIVDYIRKDLI